MNLNKRTDAFCRATIGELANRRKAAGISQNQLSVPSGLHQTAINLIEAGKRTPTIASLYRIADALGVPPSEILAAAEAELNRSKSGQGN